MARITKLQDAEKLQVKMGLGWTGLVMTRKQAQRYGDSIIPQDLKRAGFTCTIFRSDPEIHGGDWFRINFGKSVSARSAQLAA